GVGVAPVLREQVVQDVVHADGAEEAALVVDDGQRGEVVGGQQPGDLADVVVRADRLDVDVEQRAQLHGRRFAQRPLDMDDAEQLARRGLQRRAEDRKSTRLNSSHVKISYAVFCLKKKKKKQTKHS